MIYEEQVEEEVDRIEALMFEAANNGRVCQERRQVIEGAWWSEKYRLLFAASEALGSLQRTLATLRQYRTPPQD